MFIQLKIISQSYSGRPDLRMINIKVAAELEHLETVLKYSIWVNLKIFVINVVLQKHYNNIFYFFSDIFSINSDCKNVEFLENSDFNVVILGKKNLGSELWGNIWTLFPTCGFIPLPYFEFHMPHETKMLNIRPCKMAGMRTIWSILCRTYSTCT